MEHQKVLYSARKAASTGVMKIIGRHENQEVQALPVALTKFLSYQNELLNKMKINNDICLLPQTCLI